MAGRERGRSNEQDLRPPFRKLFLQFDDETLHAPDDLVGGRTEQDVVRPEHDRDEVKLTLAGQQPAEL